MEMEKPQFVVNLFAGPGTGKTTTAAALFAELKYRGVNCEYIPEYAKDATWEKRGPKVFQAQEYLFGKQHFRVSRVITEVDIVVTDSPVIMGMVYTPDDFNMPSLRGVMREAHSLYDSLNIFVQRNLNKPYETKGRGQTLEESIVIDNAILAMLETEKIPYHTMMMGRDCPQRIIELMWLKGWAKTVPAILHDDPTLARGRHDTYL